MRDTFLWIILPAAIVLALIIAFPAPQKTPRERCFAACAEHHDAAVCRYFCGRTGRGSNRR